EREPRDDQDEPGERLARLVAQDVPDQVRSGAEHYEDGGKAGNERKARQRDATADTRIAEPLRLNRRDRGQVAGDERQHAGEGNRREAEHEEDTGLLHQASYRRSSSSTRRSSAGSSGAGAGAGSCAFDHRHAPKPIRAAAAVIPAIGS